MFGIVISSHGEVAKILENVRQNAVKFKQFVRRSTQRVTTNHRAANLGLSQSHGDCA
jgi:hypothetical protein